MADQPQKPKSVEAVTQTTIERGGALALLYFDVYTKDKESAEGMLIDISNKITSEPGVVYAVGSIHRAMEMPENNYSAAAEVKVLVSTFADLVKLCMAYGPMSLEIIKPTEIKLSMHDAQQLLMNTAQMSHEYTTTILLRSLKPEERVDLAKKLKARAEHGKQLLAEAKKEGEKK